MTQTATSPSTESADAAAARPAPVRVLVPTGMLGGGFPAETIARGIAMGADVIVVDGGSTDSGPHYLGTGTAKTARAAVLRDLSIIVPSAAAAGIPVIVGSCGTSGTDSGVDWVFQMVQEIAAAEDLTLSVARIYSEQRASHLVELLGEQRIHPLAPAGPLDAAELLRCSHIVGVLGHEPIADALRAGADVVLAGRATDTALLAALTRCGARSGLACLQGRRVRWPLHDRPPQRRRPGRVRRHRIHDRTAGSHRCVHTHERCRAHVVRERRPVPDARACWHPRYELGDISRDR